jgi:hypothetical protein
MAQREKTDRDQLMEQHERARPHGDPLKGTQDEQRSPNPDVDEEVQTPVVPERSGDMDLPGMNPESEDDPA